MSRLRSLHGPALVLAILAVLWVVVLAGLFVLKPTVLSAATVTTVLQFSTILALAALGQALVILAGGAGIDLSVGGTVSLSAILAMLALKAGMPPLLLPVACITHHRFCATRIFQLQIVRPTIDDIHVF